MPQKNYREEFEEALEKPSIDSQNGVYHIDNLYFASARTYDVFKKSFKRIFDELDQETANTFAKKALEIAHAPNHNTLMALNNHDKSTNECRALTNQLFRDPIWNQLWDASFEKGKATTNFGNQYAIICWDHRYQPPVSVPDGIGGGYDINHEFGHLHRKLLDPVGMREDSNTPSSSGLMPSWLTPNWLMVSKEEKRNFQEVDDLILAAKGLPPRKHHFDTNLLHLVYTGERSPVFDSDLSGDISRDLAYVVRGVPVPQHDEKTPINVRGMGINARSGFNHIAGGIALLALIGQTQSVRNIIKKVITLPENIRKINHGKSKEPDLEMGISDSSETMYREQTTEHLRRRQNVPANAPTTR